MQLFKLTSHQQCTSDLSLNQGSLFNPNKNRNSSIKTQGGYTLWSLLSKEKIKTWNGNSLESQIQCSPTYSTRQDLNHANTNMSPRCCLLQPLVTVFLMSNVSAISFLINQGGKTFLSPQAVIYWNLIFLVGNGLVRLQSLTSNWVVLC